MATNNNSTPSLTIPAVKDLSDAVGTAAYIFEAANALFGTVSSNIIAMEAWTPGLRVQLGPVAGLSWALGELQDAIGRLGDMVEALEGARS